MNRMGKIVAYHLSGFSKPVAVLAGVVTGVGLVTRIFELSLRRGDNNSSMNFGSFDIIFAIFLFVCFMVSFKNSFNHLNTSGITRKTYCMGYALFSLAAAAVMMALFAVLSGVFALMGIHTDNLVTEAYDVQMFPVGIVFVISLFILASMGGWLISLLAYKYGKPMIIALAVSPTILFSVIPILIYVFDMWKPMYDFIKFYFGMEGPSPLLASLNFFVTAVVLALCNWLIMRKLPVKV